MHQIARARFSHDDSRIIGVDLNYNVNIFDTETGGVLASLTDPDRKYYFEHSIPQSNPSSGLVLSNGELYCPRSGTLVHVFDRLTHFPGGMFTVTDMELIFGPEEV
ncbi:Protein VPRBP [Thelohanellus kitauei]|uniref:Protein VPRBP n=1 Tax=Thelohanellus kitauei TaxID=669202 RepID=A0A0C2IIV3_THEKT|nr:Protein VPRBP [Thelohanellus kitauei]